MKKTYNIAFGGMISALSVAVMFLSALIPTASVTLAAIAGVFLVFVVDRHGCDWAVMVYITVSVISMLIVPIQDTAFSYILLFGQYSVLKSLIERINRRGLEFILKLLVSNASMIFFYFLMVTLALYIREAGFILPVMLLMGNIIFIMYDYFLSRIIILYKKKFSKYLK